MMPRKDASQQKVLSKNWLFLFTALFLTLGYFIWQMWPALITAAIHWQKQITTQLSELLYDAQTDRLGAGVALSGLSFVYGILHSLGPGHGKLIVSTYLATHPTKVKISLILTILSALLQAVVAILLVSTLLIIFDSSMHEVNHQANFLVTFSFYIIVMLGLVVVSRSLLFFYKAFSFKNKSTISPLHTDDYHSPPLSEQHTHDEGRDHKHVVDPQQINKASSVKEYLVIILSIGIRPCTGAIMVLLFANLVDIYWLGVLSAFVMAIGTAITTSTIAIMTITGRQLVRLYINANKYSADKLHLSGPLLQLLGGLLLILIGSVLLNSQPVGMSPIF